MTARNNSNNNNKNLSEEKPAVASMSLRAKGEESAGRAQQGKVAGVGGEIGRSAKEGWVEALKSPRVTTNG